ncbi:NAD-dependent epimerase/dehydratase family protein [Phreatobacter sp.]|uniref:NAD-dependent epimerase/dehydratase family protein n=1 Tax=Phreatobacter sp. TaxID=1966341 RepID=UPI0022C7D323|nr:NAD-dependent epimerase/dehydratase family protein [Phreatobacter sp.]MCZ8316882.1 NAD-dependent epimerase/dehydratase family protein [Phreatobacter sp.]
MLEGKKIFITGGAGFIGSNLAKLLLGANEVATYDNYVRNAADSILGEDVKKLKIYTGNVMDGEAIHKAVTEFQPTHIVHCAAVAGIDTVRQKPVSTLEINTLGTINLLRAAHSVGDNVERVVTFSTSEIFGSHAYGSSETSSAVIGAVGEARWTYAVSKLATEHLSLAYWTQHRLPTAVVRPFNVYGPGQVGEGALSTFIKRAIRNQDLVIHGSGTQIRAWCYVDDMIAGIMACLEHPNAVGKAFNIGNQRAVTTIYGLANTVIRLLGATSKITFQWKDYADIELRVPDANWAKSQIDFEAKVDLEEGIPLTADFYRSQAKA